MVKSTSIRQAVLSAVVLSGLAASSYGATFTYIHYADYGNDFTTPQRLNVAGVSQDGSTVIGTIRMGSGGDADRAYYWRAGTGLQTIEGFGIASYAAGISANGKTMVLNANDPNAPIKTAQGRAMVVSGLGSTNSSTTILPNGYDALTAAGISADGKTVIALQSNFHKGDFGNSRQQVTWTSTNGLTPVAGLPVNNPPSAVAAVSSDGSVIIGTQPVGSNTYGSTFRWSSAGGGTYETLYEGLNNSSSSTPCDGASAVSADGNVIAVTHGLWYENTTHAANFQNYRQLPGYASFDSSGATLAVSSSDLSVKALSADGQWAGGGAFNSAKSGWIWNSVTNTTEEITQFLIDHGISASAVQPPDDTLLDITGLAMNGNQLTIVGDTYFQNGWVATVDISQDVPEPAALAMLAFAGFGLLGSRRRNRVGLEK